MRIIQNLESTSIGKTRVKNDDEVYIGENFAAAIDGVSSKSTIIVDGKKIRIADLIVEAIKKLDRKTAPVYAKELTLEEFIQAINLYIKKFGEAHGISLTEHKLEATGAIYSKFHNQIWLVGDCRAVYDGNEIVNELKVDELRAEIRREIVKSLLNEGYTEQDIFNRDVSEDIIKNPLLCKKYIADNEETERLEVYILQIMYQALIDCGFDKQEIKEKELLKKYPNPDILQQYLKNNPNAKTYGYSVFNGIYTPIENCKVVDLPENVKHIRLSTDGIPISVLKSAKDVGEAIRMNRELARTDPISVGDNFREGNSVIQEGINLSFDDASMLDIEIKNVLERDDER